MKKILFIILFLASVAYGSAVKVPKGTQLSLSHPLSRGLKGAWFFNEGTSVSIYDSSVSNTIGTLTNGTAWTSGKYGSCLQFDGTNDFVGLTDFEDVVENDQAGTFIFWVKFDDFDGYQTIFMHSALASEGNRRYLQIYTRPLPAGAVTYIFRKDTGTLGADYTGFMTKSTLTIDTWHQVAVSSDGSTFRIYIDGHKQIIAAVGASVNNGNWFGDLASDTYSSFLGKWDRFAGADYYFDGQQDHVLYYKRALADAEIGWLYQEPFAMFDKGLGFLSGFATPPVITKTQTIIIAGRTWSFRATILCLMILLCRKRSKNLAMILLIGVSASSVRAFVTPVYDGGTGKSTWTEHCIPFLFMNTTFGEIPIGDPGQYLQVIPDWSNRGYQWDWITTDDVTEGARLYCTLENIRYVLGDDFHSIGGKDDDTPDDASEIPEFHIHFDSWWTRGQIMDATITGGTLGINDAPDMGSGPILEAQIDNININLSTISNSTDNLILASLDFIDLQPTGDSDDYLKIATLLDQTTIRFVGQDGRITADSGAISFNDENLTTTGAVSGDTFDATTDFTVGDTEIADGVITDATDLSIVANTAITGTLGAGAITGTSLITTDINPDASQDLKFYEDLVIDNAADGQKLWIYRNAAEGKDGLQLYVANTRVAILDAPVGYGFNYAGSARMFIGSATVDYYRDLRVRSDSYGLHLGIGAGGVADAKIYYNGANLIIDPKVVGTGGVHIDGATEVGDGTNDTLISNAGDMSFRGTARFFPPQVDDDSMDATNGTEGEMVFNLNDNTFYGCTVTGTPATWVAFH